MAVTGPYIAYSRPAPDAAVDGVKHPSGGTSLPIVNAQFKPLGPASPNEPFKSNVQTSTGGKASVTFTLSISDVDYIKGAYLTYTDGPLKGLKIGVVNDVGSRPPSPTFTAVNGVLIKSDYPVVKSEVTGDGVKLTPQQEAIVKKDMIEILKDPEMRRVASRQADKNMDSKEINPQIAFSADAFIRSLEPSQAAPALKGKKAPQPKGQSPN